MQSERPPLSLDALLEDPTRVTELPAAIVEALIVRHASLGQVLLGRLLALRGTEAESVPGPALIDARAAAEHLQVPESWIRDQARQGKLPSVQLGRYVRFRPADLERFAAEHRQGA